MSAVRSLTGVNRTWRGQPNSVEIDPNRTILADFALGRLAGAAPSAFGTGTFSRLNDLLPGLRKARGIHEPSLGERRVPYGRDHERHFPDRGRAFHFDWNALKERAICATRSRCEV